MNGQYVTLRVQYYRKYTLPGRRYARGPSLRRLTREARAAAMDGLTYAVDFCNCFPAIMFKLVRSDNEGAKVPFPSLTKYIKHYKQWRSFMMEYLRSRFFFSPLLAAVLSFPA